MSLKSASTVIDVPGVTHAVEHLQELASRMTSDEFGFTESDISNIEQIIEALHELEHEVEKIHEKFETETITASVLRHTLQFLPGQIQAEINAAISSARQSNADELSRLQNTLKDINDNIQSQQERHKELEKENALILPERDQVRDKHEDIIAQLNERMAAKAGKQIILNETRDKLRETNQKIVDLEEGIIQLKEDLVQERADARMEKKRLKKSVYDTTLKTREQKEVNVVKKVEVDGLQEKVFLSNSKLDEVRKSVRRYEASKQRLEEQECHQTTKLQQDTLMNQTLREKGISLGTNLEKQESAYETLKTDLGGRIKDLKRSLKLGEKKKKDQTKRKAKLEGELAEKTRIRNLDEGRVKEQNNILQEAKQDLALKAEETARLRQENQDMEERIQELGETHESIVATFQKQIEEMRNQLGKERRERMDLQGQRDSVQKEVDDFKVQTQKFMNDVNKKINEGKIQHDELTREGTSLQKAIRRDEEVVRGLQGDLNRAKTDFEEYKKLHQGEVATLEREISEMDKSTKEKQATILEKEPTFVELEKFYEQRADDYDKMKKEIVARKNRKLGLDDAVKRAYRDVEKMEAPTTQLRVDIKERKQDVLGQLKAQAKDRTEIERKIYTTGSKLRTAMDENQRFHEENTNLENQMENTRKEMDDIKNDSEKLEKELENLKGQLIREWFKDNNLEHEFELHDQNLVDELGKLLNKTEKRKHVISDVTTKLESELSVLAKFLDNVAKRRPKESANTQRLREQERDSVGALDAWFFSDDRAKIKTPRSKTPVKTPVPPVTTRSETTQSTTNTARNTKKK